MPKPELIPEKEAAAMLGYKPETLRRYSKNGRLPLNFYAHRQRNYQYDKKEIEAFILKNFTGSKKQLL